MRPNIKRPVILLWYRLAQALGFKVNWNVQVWTEDEFHSMNFGTYKEARAYTKGWPEGLIQAHRCDGLEEMEDDGEGGWSNVISYGGYIDKRNPKTVRYVDIGEDDV